MYEFLASYHTQKKKLSWRREEENLRSDGAENAGVSKNSLNDITERHNTLRKAEINKEVSRMKTVKRKNKIEKKFFASAVYF